MASSMTMPIVGMMTPWLHFSGGDNLYFSSLTPTSKGAIAGAAIVLFILAVFERWLSAMRGVMEARWRERAKALVNNGFVALDESEDCHPEVGKEDDIKAKKVVTPFSVAHRTIPPFIASHDIARGAFQFGQSLMQFTLMLAVMTFQAAYILSIVIGVGVGEMAFGRLGAGSIGHSH